MCTFCAFGEALATYTHCRLSPSMLARLAEEGSPHVPDGKTVNTSGQWIFLGMGVRIVLASFVKDKVSIGVWIYLWAFYFVPFVFCLCAYCLDCSFVL